MKFSWTSPLSDPVRSLISPRSEGKETVGEFSLICCTCMAHAGNTKKIWAKIISAHAKKCSITGFSSLRGGGSIVYIHSRGMNA